MEFDENERSQLHIERDLLEILYEYQDTIYDVSGKYKIIEEEDSEFYEELNSFTKKFEDYLQRRFSII